MLYMTFTLIVFFMLAMIVAVISYYFNLIDLTERWFDSMRYEYIEVEVVDIKKAPSSSSRLKRAQ